jgi:hypothetical protein
VTDKDASLLVPLVCPRCNGDIEAPSPSRIGLCLNCKTARFMREPSREYRLVFIEAKKQEGTSNLIYAPFWRVEGSGAVRTDDEKKLRVYQNARPLGPLYIPAFWTPKAANYENITMRYALAPDAIAEDAGATGNVLAGVLNPMNLREIAVLCYLAYLDRLADVTGVEASFTVDEVAYAAVPFLKAGAGWKDGILGLQFPGPYFWGSGPSNMSSQSM